MNMNFKTAIKELEQQGYVYETNYNTGKHSLSECMVKRWVDDGMGGYKTLIVYNEKSKARKY